MKRLLLPRTRESSRSELRKKLAMKKNGRPRRIASNKRLKQKQEAKKREAVSPNFSK
jgi:hypothetical protein